MSAPVRAHGAIVAAPGFVEADDGDHHGRVVREPADDPHRDPFVERMPDSPQLVSSCLTYTLVGRRLLLRLLLEVLQLGEHRRAGPPCSSMASSHWSNSRDQSINTTPTITSSS
jgi:hypothetical protein